MMHVFINRSMKTLLAGTIALTLMGSAVCDVPVRAMETGGAVKLVGDVNGDNNVNTTDARLLLQYAAKIETASPLDMAMADVNGDNRVNTADARLTLQTAAGVITPIHCEEIAVSNTVELRGYRDTNHVIYDQAEIEEIRKRCLGDTSALDDFDAAFFEKHSLIILSNSVTLGEREARSLALQQVVKNDNVLRIYASYTEMIYYYGLDTCVEKNSVLLIPVEKQDENISVVTNYTYELGVSDKVYPNSCFWISRDETTDFAELQPILHTVQSQKELQELADGWCRTNTRTEAYKDFMRLHDDAFFRDNVTLVLPGKYNSAYEFLGFRDNKDGTCTMLVADYYFKATPNTLGAIAPRPCVMMVDIPRTVLAEKPIDGFEIQYIQVGNHSVIG